MVTIPVILGMFRMAMAPVLLLLAWYGQETIFVAVLVIALLTDSIDGPIARHLHQDSTAGSRMDTCADVSIYCSYYLSACWLWPEVVRRELLYFVMLAASIIMPAVAGALKFRCITAYHTWLVKIASVCIAASSLLMFIFGPVLPFRIAALICLLAGLEELSITLVLDKPGSNVKSLWHVLRH